VPGQREITDWVLGPFRKEEAPVLEKVLQTGCEQIECWLASGIREAMNRFNGAVLIEES
jgi:PTH1 family peptidyl-tRNA hydrolase